MFCSKCGSRINEDAKFCSNCGAAVTQQQELTEQQMQQRNMQQRNMWQQDMQQEPKHSVSDGVKAGIIIAVALAFAVVAAGVIGTLSWYNRPINRISVAIKSDDVETVSELYGKLNKESDKSRVRQEMLNLAEELKDGYFDGEKAYDEVMDTYGLLEKEILAGDINFKKMKKQVEAVEASREAYAEAEELFEEGDYTGAKEKYMLVIKEDSNYDDARSAIAECERKITEEIVSAWSFEYDMSDFMWYGYYDDFEMPVKIFFNFKENGSGSMGVEIINTDIWVAGLTDFYKMYFEEYYNVTGDELEEFMQYMGYESLDEWVNEELEEEIEEINAASDTFEYSYDGVTLLMWDGDKSDSIEIEVVIEGDTLTFITTSCNEDFYDMGLDLPLVLTRDNEEL